MLKRKQKSKNRNKHRNTVIIEDQVVIIKDQVVIIESQIAPIDESSAVYNLDADCFFKIFDWLSLEDLYTFSETCSQFQKIAGEYFHRNYSAAQIMCFDDGILVNGSHNKMNGFSRYIENISIYGHSNGVNYGDELKKLQFIASNCGESLKKLNLVNVSLNDEKIMCIAKVLPQIENLAMNENLIFSFHWEYFLKYCVNLSRLSVVLNTNCEHVWLLHTFPNLKHIELTTDKYGFSIDELRSFFDQNRSVTSFSTTATYFCCNRNAFKNAKLDQLSIQIEDSYKINLKFLGNILNEFFESGIYKRLCLQVLPKIERKNLMFVFIHSLNALEALYISNYDSKIVLPPLINLKKLNLFNGIRMKELKFIAVQFVNLECIQFYTATSNDFLPFIQHSIKLQKIKVTKLVKGAHFNGNDLNMSAINRERKKLNGAQKVTIYVDRKIYLATKCAVGKTDFSCIELKLNDADDVNCYFRPTI